MPEGLLIPTEEEKTFSQSDLHHVQRPPGAGDQGLAKGVLPSRRPLEKYSGERVTPGGFFEQWLQTSAAGAPNPLPLEQGLEFIARTFMVDNWTNQWLYEDNIKRFIPPYSGGWILNIPSGAQKTQLRARAPQQYAQAASIAGEFVWAAWAEAFLPPSAGVLFPNPVTISPSGQNEVVITDDAGNEVLLQTAAQLALLSANNSLPTSTPGEWSITNTPAVNTQATVTRAAAGGVRHVARTAVGDAVSGTTAPAGVVLNCVLRDGATGVGAIVWARVLSLEAVIGFSDDTTSGGTMNIVGTAGNAMTLEFTAAGGANTFEGVSLTGYDAT